MTECLNCRGDTVNPRFCSRSCAATHNNRVAPKRKKKTSSETCRNCDTSLSNKYSLYCSLKCSAAFRSNERLQRWLNGDPSVIPGSSSAEPIRSFLLKEQGGLCAICPQNTSWNGLSLTFVLDHVDGDSTNNLRDNLRMVCPNCDSQLPTFKSRNRGNGRHFRRTRYAEGKSY